MSRTPVIMPHPDRHSPDPQTAAAAWDARLRSPDCTAEDHAAFEAWRDGAADNRETFEQLDDVLAALRAAGDRPELRGLREEAMAGFGRRAGVRVRARAAAVAAVVLAGVTGLALWDRTAIAPAASQVAAAPTGGKVYRTALNERTTVTLEDGSTVTLDSASGFEARFAGSRRDIVLLSGQALFHVAKDPTRPFVVRAGDRTVTALGTVFDVRLDGGKVRVTLLEGRVAVRNLAARDKPPQVLAPTQQLVDAGDVRVVDVAKVTGWTEGRVFFDDEPLSQAAAEMNRYSATKIVVADPALANLRISGMFRAGNQTGFVGALQSYLPLEGRSDDQGRILLSSRNNG
jgi:transmembrane sensor